MLFVFLFLLGLILGSFLNVVILRINTGANLKGRSKCFSCLKKLAWYDLVPLASFALIRGRCRYCRSKISIQYPIVELLSSFILVSVAYYTNPFYEMTDPFLSGGASLEQIIRYVLIASFFLILLAISVYDARHKIIPDQFSLALGIVAVLLETLVMVRFFDQEKLITDLLAAIGAFSFFGGLWFISKGTWMGFGDAKMAISLGLFLGYPMIIIGVFLAFWIGALFGIFLLLFKNYSRKAEIPFGPFLALGTYGAYVIAASDLFHGIL